MIKKAILVIVIFSVSLFVGCASVPMASMEQDSALKAFSQPEANKAGLYIYRTSGLNILMGFWGFDVTKKVFIDGVCLGATAPKTYFYKEITPGQHQVQTESEFYSNTISFQAEGGKNYFCQQYIKMGIFNVGANVEMVSEQEGIAAVRKCNLAK
jgi:hypothetical protein